jgi:hypothetical protein
MAKTIIVEVFGAQSTTATNLTAFKVRKGSRVQELGWPTVKVGWVAKARAI